MYIYDEKDILQVLDALNKVEVKGMQNISLLAFAYNILSNNAKKEESRKEVKHV